jgi:hypothetical protein
MKSAKLDSTTKSAATPSPSAAEQVGPGASKNSIKEPDSAIDTPPRRASGDPLQWNSKSLHKGNLRADFRIG